MAGAVVVGGSVAGLTAALVLARRGHAVTVLERDTDQLAAGPEQTWDCWRRTGVPHLRQLHIFNSRGRNVLIEYLPDVHRAWLDAGAIETRLPADPEVVRTNCRRTTFEWVLRRAAAHQAGVRLETGVPVMGTAQHASGRVVGVLTAGGTVARDVVIDATGRRAAVANSLGGAVMTATGPCGGVAATRWYRVGAGRDTPPQSRVDLGYAACVLTPADAGMFSVTIGFQASDRALRPLPISLHSMRPCLPWNHWWRRSIGHRPSR